ncbi:MAG: molybdenum cofactor guanylyltransferase MobA [Rhodomicrobiaceae bacterium]|jgi:molybdopterin-guanine dinucleotide biosynthesis protein A
MKKAILKNDMITGVILAGGQSTRMGGGDKFLKEINGKTILSLVIEKFEKQCNSVLISANGDPARLEAYNKPIIIDPLIEEAPSTSKDQEETLAGPLAGILAAMNWAKENHPGHTHILSVAADSPLFPDDFSQTMIKHANDLNENAVILAKSGGWHHPIFGLWPIEFATDLEAQLKAGVRKIRAWTNTHPNSAVEFEDQIIKDTKIDPFFNINKPEDFEIFTDLSQKMKS